MSSVRDVETKSTAVSDDLVHARSLIILEATLDEFGQRQEALRSPGTWQVESCGEC